MVISLPYHYRKQSLLLRELGMSRSSRLPAIVRLRQTQARRAGSNRKSTSSHESGARMGEYSLCFCLLDSEF
jgi:hypothetical protein